MGLISIAAIILVLLVLSAFFSSSETALTAASKAQLFRHEKQGNVKAALVNKLRRRKDQLIATLLLGNNLVNILASALATSVLTDIFGASGVVYATIIMTIMVLIFAEVLPKTYAFLHPEQCAMAFAPLIRVCTYLFLPLTRILQWMTAKFIRILRPRNLNAEDKNNDMSSIQEELLGAIDLHGVRDKDAIQERKMLRSILDLNEVTIEEIMQHRKDVEMVDSSLSLDKIIEVMIDSPYTRVPVWQDNKENVIGVLNVKMLMRQAHLFKGKQRSQLSLDKVMTPPWFISENLSLLDQLQAFRDKREHFAVVVDEYGAFMGIVTLEDILEEIVGDIIDESDVVMTGMRRQRDGAVMVRGPVTIRDLNRRFEWDLPDDKAATIAGFLLHESRHIPNVGQEYLLHGFRFQVLRKAKQQIMAVKIMPLS